MLAYLDAICRPIKKHSRARLDLDLHNIVTMSSDGHAAMLVTGDYADKNAEVGLIPTAAQIVATNPQKALPLSSVVTAMQDLLGPCEDCGGSRRRQNEHCACCDLLSPPRSPRALLSVLEACPICKGRGIDTCRHCERPGGCKRCAGRGEIIGDCAFNAALVVGVLLRLPNQGQPVRIGIVRFSERPESCGVLVRGEGWSFAHMGIIPDVPPPTLVLP